MHIEYYMFCRWMDVESNCPDNCGVVFIGEMMSLLTSHYLLPCMHEVANVGPGTRYSIPLQFCGADLSMIRSLECHKISCDKSTPYVVNKVIEEEQNVGEFMDIMASQRISSNFLRKRFVNR